MSAENWSEKNYWSPAHLWQYHSSQTDIQPNSFYLLLGAPHQVGWPVGCFTNVSRALQNIISKLVYCRDCTSYENFKLKLCSCAQSYVLGTRTKLQLEILTINVIAGIVHFREIILESSRNVSETTPWTSKWTFQWPAAICCCQVLSPWDIYPTWWLEPSHRCSCQHVQWCPWWTWLR